MRIFEVNFQFYEPKNCAIILVLYTKYAKTSTQPIPANVDNVLKSDTDESPEKTENLSNNMENVKNKPGANTDDTYVKHDSKDENGKEYTHNYTETQSVNQNGADVLKAYETNVNTQDIKDNKKQNLFKTNVKRSQLSLVCLLWKSIVKSIVEFFPQKKNRSSSVSSISC